jgi:glycolate oxidase
VINADLGRAAGASACFYPPDPASFETCTIGGNLAENSGGLRCVKYGVTRDWVLAWRSCWPTAASSAPAASTVKDVMGYDLTRLFVGSEGTLGHDHRGDAAAAAQTRRRS